MKCFAAFLGGLAIGGFVGALVGAITVAVLDLMEQQGKRPQPSRRHRPRPQRTRPRVRVSHAP